MDFLTIRHGKVFGGYHCFVFVCGQLTPEAGGAEEGQSAAGGYAEQATAEPFDKVDVKAMAGQCVALDTEAGRIVMEMFPKRAGDGEELFESGGDRALDTTVFSRVVPGFVIQGGDIYTREGKMTAASGTGRRTVPDEPNKILPRTRRGVDGPPRRAEHGDDEFLYFGRDGGLLDGKFAAFGR